MNHSKYIHPVIALHIDKLVPLPDNPFELYEGQRLDDLVESIQANGVLVPIIVRPLNDGLSNVSVWRYLRIHKLIPEHKRRLNSGAISIRSAVSLSYLEEDEQELVDEVLTTTRNKLSMVEAEELRKARKPLTKDFVYSTVEDKTARLAAPLKLEQSFISRYFTPEQNREEIEHIIAKALDMYFGK